jgi:Putative metallopeptidase
LAVRGAITRRNTTIKWVWMIAVGLIAGLGLAEAAAESRQVTKASASKPNRIDIRYVEPKSPEAQPIYRLIVEHKVLEKIRDILRPLRLPHRLLLQTNECGGLANAMSNEDSVIVCYELLDEIWKNAPDKTTPSGIAPIDTLIGPLVDVFLHETGHATFRMLNIPLFGREEDAADQFSTYIMLRFDKEEARRLILGAAYQYKGDLSSPTVTVAQQKFADEHGTPAQRFFNLLCMAYGADPKLFADVVEKGFLPKDRAEICESEYIQVTHAFNALIGPHIDRRLARKLHKRWLPPVTAKPKPWRGSTHGQ